MAWLKVTTYNCPKCGVNLEQGRLDLSYSQPCPNCQTAVILRVNSIATNWFTFFAPFSFGITFVVLAPIMTVFWYRARDATVTLLLQFLGVSVAGALIASFFFGAVAGVAGGILYYWRNYGAIVQSGSPSFSRLALYLGLAGILVFPLGPFAIILGIIGLRKDGQNAFAIAGIVLGSLQLALMTFLMLSGAAIKTDGS